MSILFTEVKRHLLAFSRAVNQLIPEVNNLDEISMQLMAQTDEKYIEHIYDLFETLPADLRMLNKAAALALDRLKKHPDKGGPAFANSLRVTIEALASIYEQESGKKATMPSSSGGRFFRFVTMFLSIIGARVQSDQAVGELIKKVLRQRAAKHQTAE